MLILKRSHVAMSFLSQYIVMELLRGEDLSEIRHRQSSSRLPITICVHLALEMVKLLERLHGLGIIHRDIKPK